MTDDLASRYAAAERLLPHRWPELVRGGSVRPTFTGSVDDFWFVDVDGFYRLVRPEHASVTPLFDHALLAQSLTELTGREHTADSLELRDLCVLPDGALRFGAGDTLVEADPGTGRCRAVGDAPAVHEKLSPDGRLVAFVRDHDVWVREVDGGAELRLTHGGEADYSAGTPPQCTSYGSILGLLGLRHPALVSWSPDSTRLVTHRIDERQVRWMPLVRAAPPDGGPPRDCGLRYALPGDEHLPVGELLIVDVRTADTVTVAGGQYLMPWTTPLSPGHSWWHRETGRFFFLDADREERHVVLRAAEPRTGEAVTLIAESGEARVSLGPDLLPPTIRMLASGEVLWWSERTGWGHLYLYDAHGQLVRQLTDGEWLVRGIVAVDEEERSAIIAAAGREPGTNPYVRQLYRLCLDTGDLDRITDDDLDHAAVGSPTGRHVVDVSSSLQQPASSVVRSGGGDVVLELEAADAAALLEAGYEPPEPFVVKAADGVTDVHGVLFRPHGFDDSHQWPVLDEIYPGPAHAPMHVRFPGPGGPMTFVHQPAFAALGFAVITLNNRGTPLRSRSFRDHTRGDGYDDGLLDHVVALQQLQEKHPWLDLRRVGIYGASGGGHASARALLLHPTTYRAAVAACGSHDERVYHAMWTDRFVGDPRTTDYAAKDNASIVDRLAGQLLLVHGEMDDNVTPHLTIRLVDAFMRADKDVELLLVPNADHDLTVHRHHWWRRRWDFFVRHVMGAAPPQYRLQPIPVDRAAALRRVGVP